MDYSAPSFPRVGQDMVLTCGYLHQDGLTFKAFEWSRQRERVEGLFFHYGGSRASVYTVPGDHWLNRSQTSYLLEERRDHRGAAITVLTLRLHQASPRMSGRYRCQVSMTPDDEPEDSERLATRSTEVMVVEGNPEEFAPGVEVQVHQAGAGLLLTCSAVGSPAPALTWSSVVAGALEEVADRVTWHPTRHTEEGVENASVTVREPCCGMYACTARARSGEQEVHYVSTERGEEGVVPTYIGTTTPAPTEAAPPEEDMVTPLVTGVVVAATLLLLLLICCWCLSCSRSRREKERRRKALAARLAVERGRDTLRSTLARRPRSRSVKARRAPNPALFQPIIRPKAPEAPII